MLVLSWSTAYSSLFVVPVGSAVTPGGLSTERALGDCSVVSNIMELPKCEEWLAEKLERKKEGFAKLTYGNRED